MVSVKLNNKTNEIRVCHMTSAHSSSDGRIFHKECCSLANSGLYSVFLVAPGESFIKEGVTVHGVEAGSKSRLKRMTGTAKAVYEKAKEIDAEIYHFHDPELLPYGVKLKKLGKKVVYDMHEDVPAQIYSKTWIPKFLRKPISLAYKTYESISVKKLDMVISVTPAITERFEKISTKVGLVSNFPKKTSISDEMNIKKDENVICFAGGISSQWMHENILKSLSKTNAKYALAGPSSEKYMNQLKGMPEFKKVKYFGKISREEVEVLLAESNIGMALLDYVPNVGYKKGSLGNTKLFEYMQAGLPVICTDFEIWSQIISDYKCGICVNPNDVDAIAEAITYLLKNPDLAIQMGKNGEKAVLEKYNWETEEKKLFSLYDSLLNHEI